MQVKGEPRPSAGIVYAVNTKDYGIVALTVSVYETPGDDISALADLQEAKASFHKAVPFTEPMEFEMDTILSSDGKPKPISEIHKDAWKVFGGCFTKAVDDAVSNEFQFTE